MGGTQRTIRHAVSRCFHRDVASGMGTLTGRAWLAENAERTGQLCHLAKEALRTWKQPPRKRRLGSRPPDIDEYRPGQCPRIC